MVLLFYLLAGQDENHIWGKMAPILNILLKYPPPSFLLIFAHLHPHPFSNAPRNIFISYCNDFPRLLFFCRASPLPAIYFGLLLTPEEEPRKNTFTSAIVMKKFVIKIQQQMRKAHTYTARKVGLGWVLPPPTALFTGYTCKTMAKPPFYLASHLGLLLILGRI